MQTLQKYEQDKIANAAHFQATQFCGRGKYLRHKAATKEAAIKHAENNPGKRPWMIYAISVEGFTIHVQNV